MAATRLIDFVEGNPGYIDYGRPALKIVVEEKPDLYTNRRVELLSHILETLSSRIQRPRTSAAWESELRQYAIPLSESFRGAMHEYPSISADPDIMAGAPCIGGTRIPVYMVLDALEHHGTVDGALESYPRLTAEQVKDAIGFAKLVVECPVDNETTPFS